MPNKDERPQERGVGHASVGTEEAVAATDSESRARLTFPVVGIGASAGGLAAFGDFFEAVPPDTGMAFVVIQHLAPDRKSLIAEILARRTAMPVRDADDGQAVEPNTVYVIRPGNTLTLRDGVLHLGAFGAEGRPPPPGR